MKLGLDIQLFTPDQKVPQNKHAELKQKTKNNNCMWLFQTQNTFQYESNQLYYYYSVFKYKN